MDIDNSIDKMKSALDYEKLDGFVRSCNVNELLDYWQSVRELWNQWLGTLDDSALLEIRSNYVFLNQFLDFGVLLERIQHLKSKEKNELYPFGDDLIEIIPELIEIDKRLGIQINKVPISFGKTEAYLLHGALNYRLDSSLEATVYFAAKGILEIDKLALRERLRSEMCYLIEKDHVYNKGSDDIIKRAKERTIPVNEAIELLNFYGSRPRLLGFRDCEDELIDVTLIKAIETSGLTGFNDWINDLIQDIADSIYNRFDQIQVLLFLFQVCRSDLILERINRIGIEGLLHIACECSIEKLKPWRVSSMGWSSYSKVKDNVDYVRIASVIVFAWIRIRPQNLNIEIYRRSLEFLCQTQLADGSWALFAEETEGEILTTILSLSALCIAKPNGWLDMAFRAKNWLIEQQKDSGSWYINGGPIYHIDVFCLEAMMMIEEPDKLSYEIQLESPEADQTSAEIIQSLNHNTIVFCEGQQVSPSNSQFDSRCYQAIFRKEFPKVKFYSIGSCEEIIDDSNPVFQAFKDLYPKLKQIRLIDRDERSNEEISTLRDLGVRVLSLRNIESYLLDDEVLSKYCCEIGREDKIEVVLKKKRDFLMDAISRGQPNDDFKQISSNIYSFMRIELGINRRGSKPFVFIRDNIAPIITQDMEIYKKLRMDIFGI